MIYRIPIGLAETRGHSAADVAALTHSLLQTVGFRANDLCATVNDNTASAVLAGKYIVGDHAAAGKCDMHRCELVLKHATGLVKRYKKKVLVDSFPPFIDVWEKFKIFASWLCSAKAKQRFETFKRGAAKHGRKVVAISLPNETRVSGCVFTSHDLLRDKYAMDEYCRNAVKSDPQFKKLYPKAEEWELLSQFEGILNPLKGISLSLQTDEPGSSSASLLEIYTCKYEITQMRNGVVRCVPMNVHYEDQWDASSTMKDLNKIRVKIPFDKLKKGPRDLIRRILEEFRTYLTKKDEDGLKALCSNPLLVGLYADLLVGLDAYDEESVKEVRRLFIEDMVKQFTNTQYSKIGAMMAKQQQQTKATTQVEPNKQSNNDTENPSSAGATARAATDETPDEDMNPFARIRKSRELKEQARLQLSGKVSMGGQEAEVVAALKKICTEAFDEYKSMCSKKMDNNWAATIQKYPTKLFKKHSEKWKKDNKQEDIEWYLQSCHENNFLAVGKYFDVMRWWDENKTDFPYVFVSAIIWLTKPATNAFQERIFSLGTWFSQNKLMSNLLKKHFEMRTMDCLTRELRHEIMRREKELQSRDTPRQRTLSKHVDKRVLQVEGKEDKDESGTSRESAVDLTEEEFGPVVSGQKENVRYSVIKTATNGFKEYVRSAKFTPGETPKVVDDPAMTMRYFPCLPEGDTNTSEHAQHQVTMGIGQESTKDMDEDSKPPAKPNQPKVDENGLSVSVEYDTVVHTKIATRPKKKTPIAASAVLDNEFEVDSLPSTASDDEDSDCALEAVVDGFLNGDEDEGSLEPESMDEGKVGQTDANTSDVVEVIAHNSNEKKRKKTSNSDNKKKRKKAKQMTMIPTRQSPPRAAKMGTTPPSAKLVRMNQNKDNQANSKKGRTNSVSATKAKTLVSKKGDTKSSQDERFEKEEMESNKDGSSGDDEDGGDDAEGECDENEAENEYEEENDNEDNDNSENSDDE